MDRLRIGMDIGGTFTDVTGIDETSGDLFHLKTLTTSPDPAKGVLEALDRAGLRLEKVSFLSHGTTIAINAVLEGKGASAGILTTRGFRDVLELRRGARTHLLDPLMDKPPMFVPRRWRAEVKERIQWDGTVLEPLDEEEVRQALTHLEQQGVESVAVCFLHSYVNPSHEEQAGEILRSHFPKLHYTLSAELVPEIKEYERTSTAALNAYVQPVVRRYLSHLERELRERGLGVELHIMQSNGGVMSAEEAERRPIHMLESGPAAGSIAAAAVGRLMGLDNLISFDMGGTTTKASVIEGGQPLPTVEYELFEAPNKPGSGWPIRVPMIDIIEVGAGGGSIAWLDHGSILQVGPQSAGADPGPVCYGRGGAEPTITDANAVLGRLVALLDGDLPLDVEKARSAIDEGIARPLGLSVEEAASGVLEIADAKTASTIREVTIARGRDPRDFALVAFGGAGPLQAAYVIGELGIPQAIIPPAPGNFSALGLLSTDIIHDAVRTHMTLLEQADLGRLNALYQEMEEALAHTLHQEGISGDALHLLRSVDMRYKGQFHIINIPVTSGALTDVDLRRLEEAYHQEHLRLYTYYSRGEPTELVNLRVRGVGVVPRPALRRLESGDARDASKGTRSVYFREARGPLECQIYARDQLGAGSFIEGPAIIEERTSTTLVPPGLVATIDEYANIILKGA